MYNHAHGLYADTWSAWAELIINISITLVAGYFWGITGILLGKVISTTLIIIIWKPYYLFTSGLHKNYKDYWNGASRNFIVSIISFFFTHIIIQHIKMPTSDNFLSWALFCIIAITIYLLINIALVALFCRGAKDSFLRISDFIKKRP